MDDFASPRILTNTNSFTVGVREVVPGSRGGEATFAFFVLAPGERHEVFLSAWYMHRFHLEKDEIQIGFLNPVVKKKGMDY